MALLHHILLFGIEELAGKETHQIVKAVTLCGFVKLNQAVGKKLDQRVLRVLRRYLPQGGSCCLIKCIREDGQKAEFLPQFVMEKHVAGLKGGVSFSKLQTLAPVGHVPDAISQSYV